MRRSIAGIALVAAGVVAAMVVTSDPALADTTLTVSYPINGSTFIDKTGSSVPLGPGTLTTTADLTTGTITGGTITLPPATGSFKELGIIPVTATTEFIQSGPATGTVNLSTGAVQATAQVTIQITSLNVAGLNIPVGSSCQTVTPASITLSSTSGFSILSGGTVTGTYTIPPFINCDLEAPLIDLTIPGPNNTISLTLGAATLAAAPATTPKGN
jgi:hypothetical protein